MNLPPLVPANAIEMAISVAILVIAFIGWIVQMASGNKAAPPQNRPVNRPPGNRPPGNRPPGFQPPARRDERLQSEIDSFLREVSGNRKPVRPAAEDEPVEVFPDDTPHRLVESRRTTAPARPATARSATARPATASRRPIAPPTRAEALPSPDAPAGRSGWDAEQQRRREHLVSNLAGRHIPGGHLGDELRQHVEEYMAEHSHQLAEETQQARRELAAAKEELRVLRDGRPPALQPTGSPPSIRRSGRGRVAGLLRRPGTVRDAIVINEVLARPLALRDAD